MSGLEEMLNDIADDLSVAKIAGDILVAYLSRQTVDPEELPALIREVRAAVAGSPSVAELARVDQAQENEFSVVQSNEREADKPIPAVSIEQSVADGYIICLEDGGKFRSLRRHLKSKYSMTPEQYRVRWGLPDDYPMVAPELSARRSAMAKAAGFGQTANPPRAK